MSDAFTSNVRKRFTVHQKAQIFLAAEGRCHRCTRKLSSGDDWTVEHLVALQNGGTNDVSNMSITCSWCFRPKNAEDAKKAAKGRRVAVNTIVPRRERLSKTPMPHGRYSKTKRKMNGQIVERE